MDKLRIAFIGQKAVPFYRDGGVERHVEEISTRLAARGHDVTVFVRPRYLATKEDIWERIKLVRVPSIPTKNLDTITATLSSTLYALGRSYDVIHFHGVGPSTLAWLPRLLNPRAKIIATFHSIDRFHKKWGICGRAYLTWGEWTVTHFPHATIAVSKTIQKYCRKKFNKETTYIPNGVCIQKMTAKNELKRWDLKPNKYIITVARLVRHKGIHYLIEAFKKIPDDIKQETKLVIIGAPSFTSDYETYLKNLAADDHRIIFTGFQDDDVLRQLYAHSMFYVHPSESEGLSLTILEAMSYGKCVIMSNIPENLEAIDHSGVAFKVGDSDALRDEMVALMNHQDLLKERGEKAIQFIKEKFDWEKIVDKTEALYKQVLK